MDLVFKKILELSNTPSYSKHDQLVQGIIHAIDEKIVVKGDTLPSIKSLAHETGFARETILNAYRELISRGIVASKKRLGYFVANSQTNQILKVALVMFLMDSFQEQLYRSFRNTLGPNVHIDIFFHHGNMRIFESILEMIRNNYGIYVIAPIPHSQTPSLLNDFPRDRFYMIDRHVVLKGEFNYLTQEFEESSYRVFKQLATTIRKFDEIIFLHDPESLDPVEITRAFLRFGKDFNIKTRVLPEYIPGSAEKRKVYFTLDNAKIWKILKDCSEKKLKVGRDVGILSHDDEIVKEFVAGGITTYSADFAQMGKQVAEAVLKKQKIQETIPTILFRRKSL